MLEGMIPYLCRATKQTLLLVILLVAVFSQVSLVFAQAFPPGSPPDPFTPAFPVFDPVVFPPPTGPTPTNTVEGSGTGGVTALPGGVDAVAAGTTPLPDGTGEQTKDTATVQVNYACYDGIGIFLHCITVSVFGGLAAVAGYALDRTIEWFIVDFGEMYNQNGLGAVADSVWETVRDIFNLTFIFGLVYIGFQIILGTNDSAAKRTIPLLIIAALLVNFSLFIVKFIVDFANLAAVQIYNLFQASNDSSNPASSVVGFLTDGDVSIALAFLNLMGVTSLLGYQPNGDSPLIFFFGTIIVFLVLTYVFLAGAVMISVRFVALIFYIIFSPIMFLGWVFPGLDSYTKQFWKGLINQAFFAPAFLFMLYISFRLIQGYNFAGRTGTEVHTLGETVAGQSVTASLAAIVPFFILTVIFLLASVIVARKMASSGSEMVMKANNWGIGKAKAFATGAAGGFGASAYLGYKGIDKAANSNSRLLGARALAQGVSKYTGARDALEKSYKGSYIGSSATARDKRSTEMAVRKSQSNLSRTLSSEPKDAAGQIKFEQAVTDASTSQIIKELEKYTPESKEYERIVRALSPSQVSKIYEAKDDEFSPTQKAKFGSVRAEMVKQKLTSAPIGSASGTTGPKLELAIERDASADDLKHLGLDTLRKNAAYITASKMDDLKTKLSPTEWAILNNERKEKLKAIFDDKPESVFKTVDGKRKKDKDIAKLPGAILSDPDAAQYLNSNVLNAILNDDALNASDREKIIENIYALGKGHPVSVNVHDWLTKTPAGRSFVTTI
jgi:hypothetical protein